MDTFLNGYCELPASPTGNFHGEIDGEGSIKYGFSIPGYYNFGVYNRFIISDSLSLSRRGMGYFRLDPVADAGWHFTEWSWNFDGTPGTVEYSALNTLKLTDFGDGNLDVTAHFEPDALYTLTVTEDGEGTATYSPVEPSGYGLGESVWLEATPELGWEFLYWQNVTTSEIVSYQDEYIYTIEGDANIVAVFEALNSLTLTVEGQGRVDRSDNRIYYPEDTELTLTAVPNPGWEFVQWTEDGSGVDAALATTMDNPKSITAEFAPEFNVQVDINDDGDWTNDDEYEPGGSQESSVGELMHLLNGIDNGTKPVFRTILVWHRSLIPMPPYPEGSKTVSRSDDLQVLELNTTATEGTLDLDNPSTALEVRFFTSNDIFVEYYDDKWKLANEYTDVTFPLEFSNSKPFPDHLYMVVSGQLEPGTTHETFDLMFTLTSDGKQFSDTIRVTVSGGLGDSLFANEARDYIVEHDDVVYYSEQFFPKDPNQQWEVDETYCVVMMPHERTNLTALDAGVLQNPPGNIHEVCTLKPGHTAITTSLYCFSKLYRPNVPKRTNGAVIQDKVVQNTAAFRFPTPPLDAAGKELPVDRQHVGYVAQAIVPGSDPMSLRRIQVGLEFGDIVIDGPGGPFPPGDPWDPDPDVGIPIYVDNPQAWDAPNGFTSETHYTAFYGFADTTVIGHNNAPSSFVALLSETDIYPQVEEGKFVCVAITRILSTDDFFAQRGFGQSENLVGAMLNSGGIESQILRMDGGASGAMALKSPQGYSIKTRALRHEALWPRGLGRIGNYMLFDVGTTVLDDEDSL